MQAIQALKPGDHTVLKSANLPEPTPGDGELLVQTHAIGVNYIDIYRRSGTYRMPFPHIPGSEGVGEVIGVGEKVEAATKIKVGTLVAWADSVSGSYAEQVVIRADQALPVPTEMPAATAAALPLQGMTADYLVRSAFKVEPGMTVAVYAAAGGVGSLAVQMVLAARARVLAVVSSATKAEQVADLGVPISDIIVTGPMRDLTKELPVTIQDLTSGQGVDAVYDSVGHDTFFASLRSLRRRGTLVLFGASSGPVARFDPQELNAHGSLFLTRPTLADYTATRAELIERAGRVFGAATRGDLQVNVGTELPLAEAAEAHRLLTTRATTGKVILVP